MSTSSFNTGLSYSGNSSYSGNYSYAGNNSYAGNQSYHGTSSYTAPSEVDAHGYSGDPGNPMLVDGINATRSRILRAAGYVPGDDAFVESDAKRPAVDGTDIWKWAGRSRSALYAFELLSGASFSPVDKSSMLALEVSTGKGKRPLITMDCPSMPDFAGAQLSRMLEAQIDRPDRMAEILTQTTPPLSYFAAVVDLKAGRHRRTLELLDAGLQFAYTIGMRFKHAFGVPRPSEISPAVLPMIEVPGHGAYPMGHANEAIFTAQVIGQLVAQSGTRAGTTQKTQELLRRVAHQIAYNRIVAGVHYPVDGHAGVALGDALSGYFLARCGAVPQAAAAEFRSKGFVARGFDFDELPEPVAANLDIASSPLLKPLWEAALKEWS